MQCETVFFCVFLVLFLFLREALETYIIPNIPTTIIFLNKDPEK